MLNFKIAKMKQRFLVYTQYVFDGVFDVVAESKEEAEKKDKKYFLKTFQTSSYSQSFNLPTTVNPDSVEAKFEDGVLTVRLPKAKETQAKQITIK